MRSAPPVASAKRLSNGTIGSGSPRARRPSSRAARTWSARGRRRRPSPARGRGAMADEIKTLSADLAQDPDSLVFLRLGELLRRKGQVDLAHRVALTGLERHPHLADAHDLYARILADKREYERAFDEWERRLRMAPNQGGARKGLASLYFKSADVDRAAAHLEAPQRAGPADSSIAQALELARRGQGPAPATPEPGEHARVLERL